MSDVFRKFDLPTKEKRDVVIQAIITYFHEERNEEIGVIAAGEFLDFLLQLTGEDMYNKAIDDAKKSLKEGFDSIEVNLDSLLIK